MDVGDPVVATDPNSTEPNDRGADTHDPSSDKLTYEIDDERCLPVPASVLTCETRNDPIPASEDASFFSINKTSGQLMVNKSLGLG